MSTGTQVERSERKQRQLLDAAERVYSQHGDLGLTVRRLAAEADATSQTIYTYFGSRDAVIDGMYNRITDDVAELLKTLEAQLEPGEDGTRIDSLAQVAATYRRYCVDHPARFIMLSGGHGPKGWDPVPMVELRQQLVALIERSLAGAAGGDTSSRLLLAAWHGVIQAELDDLLPPSDTGSSATAAVAEPDQLLRSLVERLVPVEALSASGPNGS